MRLVFAIYLVARPYQHCSGSDVNLLKEEVSHMNATGIIVIFQDVR